MPVADPRSCLRNFLQTGRNLGRRVPSLSLRNVHRDIRAIRTSVENIGDRIEGAIGAATRGEFLPGQLLSAGNELRCPPTPYVDYFSQYQQPKFKFMFFVSMRLNPDFEDAFGGTAWKNGDVWWFIKQSGRPNVTYEYEETNMYNFRQKVLRRAILEPIQIQMYDDLKDASHSFWTTFLRIQNPVTNINVENFIEENGMNWNNYDTNLTGIRSDNGELVTPDPVKRNPNHLSIDSISAAQVETMTKEQKKDAYDRIVNEPAYIKTGEPPPNQSLLNSAGTGLLPGENGFKQIIKEINVHHLIDWGRKVVTYNYINPRINEIRMDELNWESSEPNVIDVTFEYDTFQVLFPMGVTEETAKDFTPAAYPINVQDSEVPNIIPNAKKAFFG